MKIKYAYSYYNEFEGREEYAEHVLLPGETLEDEMARTMEYYGKDFAWILFYVEVLGGWLDLGVFRSLPKERPSGCGIVVFVRASHADGHDYNWQTLALPVGTHRVESDGSAIYENGSTKDEIVVENVTVCHTMDSNGNATFRLPAGSWKFVDGKWAPCNEVTYNY